METERADASLPYDAPERLRAYRDLLLRWNLRFNLTAITEPAAIDRKLIGDALTMLPALDDAVSAWDANRRTDPDANQRPALIDIGSGAGFPGLVLAIIRPTLDVTLLEATGKKVGFLEAAIVELGLANARALHGRAEELAHQPHHREHYDITTARAVASLPALMELCAPFLRIGGVGIFPKGMEIANELAAGDLAAQLVGARIVGSEPAIVPDAEPVTRLVVVVKLASTPKRYPRRSGLPAKEPLGRVDR
jgi:16S rRNA (guanine527-N7)-methyltransferase